MIVIFLISVSMRYHWTFLLLSSMPLCLLSYEPKYQREDFDHYLFTEDPGERRNIDWAEIYSKKKRIKNCLTVRLNTDFTIFNSRLKLIKHFPVEMKV